MAKYRRGSNEYPTMSELIAALDTSEPQAQGYVNQDGAPSVLNKRCPECDTQFKVFSNQEFMTCPTCNLVFNDPMGEYTVPAEPPFEDMAEVVWQFLEESGYDVRDNDGWLEVCDNNGLWWRLTIPTPFKRCAICSRANTDWSKSTQQFGPCPSLQCRRRRGEA